MLISKLSWTLLSMILWCSYSSSYIPPYFEMKRLSMKPVISSWANNSEFLYNYNSAFMPMKDNPNMITLLVRVQNLLNDSKTIYDVGPSKIAVSRTIDNNYLTYSYITQDNIIIDIDRDYQSLGAEDPRIVLFNETYYL